MKTFNLYEVIQERVNKEALEEWSKSENPPLPEFEKPKKIKRSAGLYNFILLVKQLKP